ncbi:MAG: hypothetical protein U9Q20_01465 [Campylobacterota bacterium]|nr:hypothetical protein [Campylobacterota bacterium]
MKTLNNLIILSLFSFGHVVANDTFDLVLNSPSIVKKEKSSIDYFKDKVNGTLTSHIDYISNKKEIINTLKTLNSTNNIEDIYKKINNKFLQYNFTNYTQKISLLSYYIDTIVDDFDKTKVLIDHIIKNNNKELHGNILKISYKKDKRKQYITTIKYILNHPNKNSINFLQTNMMDKKISIFDFRAIVDFSRDDIYILKQLINKGLKPNLYELAPFFQPDINNKIKDLSNDFYTKINDTIKYYLTYYKNDIYKNHSTTFLDQDFSSFNLSLDIFFDTTVKEYFYTLATQQNNTINQKEIIKNFLNTTDISYTSTKTINSYKFFMGYKNRSNNYIQAKAFDRKTLIELKNKHNHFVTNYLLYSKNIYKIVTLKDKKYEYKPTNLAKENKPYCEHIRVYLSFLNNYTKELTNIKYKLIFKDNQKNKILSKIYKDKVTILPNQSNSMDTFWHFENDEFTSDEEYDKLIPYYIKNDLNMEVELISAIYKDGTKIEF